ELLKEWQREAGPAADGDAAESARPVVLTVLGQTKMGKSSVINALLGEQRAKTDVIRATAEITRYQLQPEGAPAPLQVLDTVGYAHTGPGPDQLRATQEAASQSDLVLLVLHARNPARQADLDLLRALGEYLAAVVPVCTAPRKIYGVDEWLMPAIVELLDQARAVALLRCLKAEADAGKIRKVFSQLLAAGKEGLKIFGQVMRK